MLPYVLDCGFTKGFLNDSEAWTQFETLYENHIDEELKKDRKGLHSDLLYAHAITALEDHNISDEWFEMFHSAFARGHNDVYPGIHILRSFTKGFSMHFRDLDHRLKPEINLGRILIPNLIEEFAVRHLPVLKASKVKKLSRNNFLLHFKTNL